jgi:hypothetical protein
LRRSPTTSRGTSAATSRMSAMPLPVACTDCSDSIVDGFAQVEGLALQVELAGLDAREARHVLEDLEQRQVGVADRVEILALAAVEGSRGAGARCRARR